MTAASRNTCFLPIEGDNRRRETGKKERRVVVGDTVRVREKKGGGKEESPC